MPFSTLINRPCTLIRRSESGSTDDYGNPIPDEDLIQTVCEAQQRRREEDQDEGEVGEGDWVVFFLPGEVVRTGDAVEVDGIGTLELVGIPDATRNPRTRLAAQVEVSAKLVAGTEDAS